MAGQDSVVSDEFLTDDGDDLSARGRKSADAFRTISEVADELGVQQHVLRFWETKFSRIKPLKRGGGRRYYRPEDVALLKRIHHLLYSEGYTIRGVQKLLREQGKAKLVSGDLSGTGREALDPEILTAEIANTAAPLPTSLGAHTPMALVQAAAPRIQQSLAQPQGASSGLTDRQRAALEETLSELRDLSAMLRSAASA